MNMTVTKKNKIYAPSFNLTNIATKQITIAMNSLFVFSSLTQSYIYQVLQTIQMKLILLCVWAEPAVLGSAKTAVKFIYKI